MQRRLQKHHLLSLLGFAFASLITPICFAATLFNLTGSTHGFGDVVGPFLLAKSEKKVGESVYLLVDERAETILRTFLERKTGKLESAEGMKIVRAGDLRNLNRIDRLYETFYRARLPAKTYVDPLPSLPRKPRTIVRTDDLHSPYGRTYLPAELLSRGIGEVETDHRKLFYSAAGLGRSRLGILTDETVDAYIGKDQPTRRLLAAEHFASSSLIRKLLVGEIHPHALLAFGYGLHNEVFESPEWKPYPGQFRTYAEGLTDIAAQSSQPVVFLSPNKIDIIRHTVMAESKSPLALDRIHIAEESELLNLGELKAGHVYLISTNPLSHKQFVALTAASDLPYMIEGDSALSAAVRLGKPFVMLKGPWGFFGVDGLATALREVGAKWVDAVYPYATEPGKDTPNFRPLIQIYNDPASFASVKAVANDWAKSLRTIVQLSENTIQPEHAFTQVTDPVLKYSHANQLLDQGLLTQAQFNKRTSTLTGVSFIVEQLEHRLPKRSIVPARCSAVFD